MSEYEESHNPTFGSYQPHHTAGEFLIGAVQAVGEAINSRIDLGWTALKKAIAPIREITEIHNLYK